MGDRPIQPEYHRMMNTLAHVLDEAFNGEAKGKDRTTAFFLAVFPIGEEGRFNYISNGLDRRDVVVLLKEMIARFEGQPEVSGRA